jgi:hypothetical protein
MKLQIASSMWEIWKWSLTTVSSHNMDIRCNIITTRRDGMHKRCDRTNHEIAPDKVVYVVTRPQARDLALMDENIKLLAYVL